VLTVGTMFHSKSLVFVLAACGLSVGSAEPQTFFHTKHGEGGSYTSISHGAATIGSSGGYSPPTAYKVSPVRPAYHRQPTTYQQPTSYRQPKTYQQPSAYQQPSVYQPSAAAGYPRAQSAAPTYGEKCLIDYQEEYAEICTPTLETSCTKEAVSNGLRLTEEYYCYPVKRTVCTEFEDIDLVEVCAVAYSLEEVPSKATLAEVKWEKSCKEEVFCSNPHSAGAYHAASYCKEEIKSVCSLYPVVYAVEKTVFLKLPQPYDTCITKEIILPRVKCQQVSEKRCTTVAKTFQSDEIDTDKCTVELGPQQCEQATFKLPRQGCLEKFKKTNLVYEEEEVEEPSVQSSYRSAY